MNPKSPFNEESKLFSTPVEFNYSYPLIGSMDSSIWGSPNINQMTEMSQKWFQNMFQDTSEIIKKVSIDDDTFNVLDYSNLVINSQPQNSHLSAVDDSVFPYNSLPNPTDCDFGINYSEKQHPYSIIPQKLLTPEDSFLGSKIHSKSQLEPFSMRANALARGRKYHNSNTLAQYCQELLSVTAHPDLNQIMEIVGKLKRSPYASSSTDKKLKSSIREWFRKRREYMATKVYRSCQRLLPAVPNDSGNNIEDIINSIHKNEPLIAIIAMESKLPMQSEIEKFNFVKEKIVDYYLRYPQRKLRNSMGFKSS